MRTEKLPMSAPWRVMIWKMVRSPVVPRNIGFSSALIFLRNRTGNSSVSIRQTRLSCTFCAAANAKQTQGKSDAARKAFVGAYLVVLEKDHQSNDSSSA